MTKQVSRHQFSHVLVAQLTPVAVSLLVVFYTAFALGAEGRGQVAYMLGTLSMVGALSFFSLHVGTSASIREGDPAGLITGGLLALASAIALGGVSAWVLWASPQGLGVLTIGQTSAVVAAGSLAVISLFLGRTLQSLERSRAYRNGVLLQSITFGLMAIAGIRLTQDPNVVLAAWAASTAISVCVYMSALSTVSVTRDVPRKATTMRVLGLSLSAHAGIWGQQLLLRADLILLGLIGTAADVGVYSVAAPIAGILWLGSEALALVAGASATKMEGKDVWARQAQLSKQSMLLSLIGAPFILMAAYVAPSLLPGYEDVPLLVAILIPGIIVQGIARIWLSTLQLLALKKQMVWIGASSAAIALIYIPMIQAWGTVGAATGSVLCYSLQALLVHFAGRSDRHSSVTRQIVL